MCKSQVSKLIGEYLGIFEEVLCPKWISSYNIEEENLAKEALYNRGGIPGVVGCVDGTHVRIKSPGRDLMHLYHNYKGFYSINVMAICDHNMVIKFVDARHPGRNHYAFIWEQSAAHQHFKENFLKGKRNTWLLVPAADLWKGVTAVSNAGKKRGRGKGTGKKTAKDLNRGQIIGVGSKNILWPGLNSPVIKGKDLVQQEVLPNDNEREKILLKLRDSVAGFRVMKIDPIDRGWSGSKMPGRSIGQPDSVGDDTFDGFNTMVLENKIVFIMKGNLGRKRRFSVMSVTGNGKGLAGFATAKAPEARTALRKSKNRAGQKLMKIELCENRTVFHDFCCAFGKTKIFVSKKPEGYGLVCHRAIQTICKVIGIRDLHAKIEGSTNIQHIVKAFFIGILKQKTHKQIAEEKQLHLVEFRKDQNGLPNIVASPNICRRPENITKDEVMDFTQYILGNKIVLNKSKRKPFYAKNTGFKLYCIKNEHFRNQDKVRLNMLVNYGKIKGFLSKIAD